MMPLFLIKSGEVVKIVSVGGGRGAKYRLSQMGLSIGDIVQVVQNTGGPVIIKKGNIRIAIGAGLSGKIFVIPYKK